MNNVQTKPFNIAACLWAYTASSPSVSLFAAIHAANSVEPYGYLIALLKALPLAHSADDHEALLPWQTAAAQ